MQELQTRKDVAIIAAHKGGAVVIQDAEDQVKEVERQLDNKENFRKINFDLTTANSETIYEVISRF